MSAVIESLAGADAERLARSHSFTAGEIRRAREAFVTAGARAVRELPIAGDWLELRLTIEGARAETWRELISGEVHGQIAEWLDVDDRRRFFFVFKPPGARLRFLGVDAHCRKAIAGWLDRFEREGHVRGWSAGAYDPEVCQLGGTAGLALAHHFFTVESLAVLAYARCWLSGAAHLNPTEFSLIVLHRALGLMTDDLWEVWDVWSKMTLTGRLTALPSLTHPEGRQRDAARRARALLERADVRLERVSDAERAIFDRYDRSLAPVAGAAREAVDAGSLLWGLREILPFWIVFHWNRMLFTPDHQAALAKLMWWAWSPKEDYGAS